MGKGMVKSHIGEGLYEIDLNYYTDDITAEIDQLDTQIAALSTEIAEMDDGIDKHIAQLKKTALENRKSYYEKLVADATVTVEAWCADLTEDLSGEVGTIEIPGEIGAVQIQPGYDGNAAYNAARDGQMCQGKAVISPYAWFYNKAMLPGWQKWMPYYRHGTITKIDYDESRADVTLDAVNSSQTPDDTTLDVNYVGNLGNVPIEYMGRTTDLLEFVVGDHVVVKFENVDKEKADANWDSPLIIGFVDHPKGSVYERWGDPTSHTWTDGNSGDFTLHSFTYDPSLRVKISAGGFPGGAVVMYCLWDDVSLTDGIGLIETITPVPDDIPYSNIKMNNFVFRCKTKIHSRVLGAYPPGSLDGPPNAYCRISVFAADGSLQGVYLSLSDGDGIHEFVADPLWAETDVAGIVISISCNTAEFDFEIEWIDIYQAPEDDEE